MTNYQINISCTHCSSQFLGALENPFESNKTYAATCPKCKKETFFPGKGAFLERGRPADVVAVKYVAVL